MNDVPIRTAKESNLQKISKLAIELIQSVKNKEGIDKRMVLKNCQNHPTLGKNH